MARAIWQGAVLAESDDYVIVEGRIYFPPESVNHEHLRASDRTTTDSWKGEAVWFDVVVERQVRENAAWSYPEPSRKAAPIRAYVAFGEEITVED